MTELHALRRRLHAYPETGFTEIVTAATVLGELRAAGIEPRYGEQVCTVEGLGGLPDAAELAAARERAAAQGVAPDLIDALSGGRTGILAEVHGNHPGPVLGIRFDMDALPVTESDEAAHFPAAQGFASTRAGLMHACGHDGHTAIGVELGRRLAADPDFPGTVRLLFQPAEEGVRGARALVEAGACNGIDTMLALHLGLGLEVGTVAATARGMLATVKLRVRLTGRAAHAALAPNEGRNALLAATHAANALHAMPPIPGIATRVNVGTLRAGTAANIVPEHAELGMELRAETTGACAELIERARTILEGAAHMHGVELEIAETGKATVAVHDEAVCAGIIAAAQATAGVRECLAEAPMSASDDATLLIDAVREQGGAGAYFLVGADNPAPHHHGRFDIDERSLPIAAELLERFVRAR
ncbi:amidohydrolase [Sciscionella sediminilitoris]|uniref:amidohydrolase n=1 Tax=Sciscionella sediminilitoris TaxID=1445613 RepID=UPI0004DEDD65|nr:amidohydrolase [Sciscionella sp. SE31]